MNNITSVTAYNKAQSRILDYSERSKNIKLFYEHVYLLDSEVKTQHKCRTTKETASGNNQQTHSLLNCSYNEQIATCWGL